MFYSLLLSRDCDDSSKLLWIILPFPTFSTSKSTFHQRFSADVHHLPASSVQPDNISPGFTSIKRPGWPPSRSLSGNCCPLAPQDIEKSLQNYGQSAGKNKPVLYLFWGGPWGPWNFWYGTLVFGYVWGFGGSCWMLLLQCSGDTYGLVRFKQKSFRRSNVNCVHH